jgi:hypothetical protein
MGEQPSRRETTKNFAAGALLANAPMWILTYILLAFGLRGSPSQSAVILNLSTMGCGIPAGVLVARKTGLEARKIVLTLTLLSYILFALFLMFVGFRGELIEETSPLTGFFIGSAIGSKLWENHQSKLSF